MVKIVRKGNLQTRCSSSGWELPGTFKLPYPCSSVDLACLGTTTFAPVVALRQELLNEMT